MKERGITPGSNRYDGIIHRFLILEFRLIIILKIHHEIRLRNFLELYIRKGDFIEQLYDAKADQFGRPFVVRSKCGNEEAEIQ
jgi:hypothetical protein